MIKQNTIRWIYPVNQGRLRGRVQSNTHTEQLPNDFYCQAFLRVTLFPRRRFSTSSNTEVCGARSRLSACTWHKAAKQSTHTHTQRDERVGIEGETGRPLGGGYGENQPFNDRIEKEDGINLGDRKRKLR